MPHPFHSKPARPATIEWPTIGLCATIYGGWLALTFFYRDIPWPLLLALGGWLVAWHMSFQHEVLHGHPTRWRALNDALGFPPLTLWLPYRIYRASHLRHHRDHHLTDPLEDPESYYLAPARYARLGRWRRAWLRMTHTFPGRITLGAVWSVLVFLSRQARLCRAGNRALRRIWFWHLLAVAGVLLWLLAVCGMPLWLYLLCFVVPARMLASIRSFAEHRAAPAAGERTAIVENAPVLGLLFLYNNLHAVHHAAPGLPWYRIPGAYRRHRAAFLQANGYLVYAGYWEVAWRYFWRPHHPGPHPGFSALRAPLPGSAATTPAGAFTQEGLGSQESMG
ncbi:fatty acid desaturase [Acidisoma sp. C75]